MARRTLKDDLLEGGVKGNYYQHISDENTFFTINKLFSETWRYGPRSDILDVKLYAKVDWISSDGAKLKKNEQMHLEKFLESSRVEMESYDTNRGLDLDDPARFGVRPKKKYK